MSATSEPNSPPDETAGVWELESPSGSITAFAWSPDGALLATAHTDAYLRIWQQTPTGFLLRKSCLIRQTKHVQEILWSPNRLKLAFVFHSDDDLWVLTLASDGEQRPSLKGVRAAAWSRDGENLYAVLEEDRCLRWHVETNERQVVQSTYFRDVAVLERAPHGELYAMVSPSSPELRLWSSLEDLGSIPLEMPMTGLAWSPDGATVAVFGEATSNIELISPRQARRTGILQGLLGRVRGCEFSEDGQLILAYDTQDCLWLWKRDKLQLTAQRLMPLPLASRQRAARLHPRQSVLTILTGDQQRLLLLELLSQASTSRLPATVRQVSAKVVLVGEARVGKTCLALRLAEGRYAEQKSTHGMHFWPIPQERLDPLQAAPPGERRDVVLWDLGGQEEYRLVHQLFLHDTTLALVLFDPLQGQSAFDAVVAWNKRFERQVNGRPVVKLLVGTKQDDDTPVDRQGIAALVKRCGFADYFPTSAKENRGIDQLKAAIAQALDWPSLSLTSRPDLFQRIQDEIEAQRSRGTVVLPLEELERVIKAQKPDEFDARALPAVVEQLALQGVIALTTLEAGDPVLVLQLGEVERYAGSLILAARDNPVGVPAIEQAQLTLRSWELPLIPREKRLPLIEERLVLECVVQLFIKHGLCIQHAGLLVFPTLFRTTEALASHITPAVSISYELSGAVDNLYSSLVANVALSQQFGRMRLWEDRAEFEETGRGACGLRRMDLPEGAARLDVYFDARTEERIRHLFTGFVEDHLRRTGVRPSLRHASPQPGASIAYGLRREAQHLRDTIEEHRRSALERTRRLFGKQEQPPAASEPLRILHLSDLHMRADSDVASMLQPLITDLRDGKEGLGLKSLDYLLISGDLTERATPEEFEQAQRFVAGLIEEFTLTAQRCVIVPGNHDLSWDEQNLYDFRLKRQLKEQLKPGHYVEKESWYLIRNEKHYPLRFRNFSKSFYHPLMQREYPLEFPEQGLVSTFPDAGLQVLSFNSSWEIDEHNPLRASIHEGALARALRQANHEQRDVQSSGKLGAEQSLLRIAVWHHPVTGPGQMSDNSFIDRLRQADVRLCLHGHVHESRADLMGYFHPTRKLHVVGAGSFGAPAADRPESTPRLYNVLEVQRTHDSMRVHTRCMRKQGGAWEGWAVWPGATATERRTCYEVKL
ncbi:MAG: metallophosphoesterase [Myxococcaceae bacterium]|nr:metallophosphoesterase [Myxococcaceae bacterium]